MTTEEKLQIALKQLREIAGVVVDPLKDDVHLECMRLPDMAMTVLETAKTALQQLEEAGDDNR